MAAEASPSLPSSADVPLSPLRLLLIDDDAALLSCFQEILETDGHSVAAANGGEAGIRMFQEAARRDEPFLAVLTDLGMPHVDGRKVALAVKACSSSTPVILLTGWGQKMLAEGDAPEGVDYILGKPPKLADLRKALAACTKSIAAKHC
jgi:CheY-like chemotaxis protein